MKTEPNSGLLSVSTCQSGSRGAVGGSGGWGVRGSGERGVGVREWRKEGVGSGRKIV